MSAMTSATVVITGANKGLGLELTKRFVARGDNVYACCRKTSDALAALSPTKIVEGIDVGKDAVGAALSTAMAGLTIDLLINNAGVLYREGLDDLNFDNMRNQYEVNALGPLRVTSALRSQLRSPGARVSIITSLMGSIDDNGSGGMYGYRMSKCAVNMAGKSLAMDLKEAGITVQLHHPGQLGTEMITQYGWNGETVEAGADGVMQLLDGMALEHTGEFFHANYGKGPKQLTW